MRRSLRPAQYLRMIENRFTTTEDTFIDMMWRHARLNPPPMPLFADRGMPVWVGVDASVKRDSTAIVAVTVDRGKVRLLAHSIFQPSVEEPLDFEATVEATILNLSKRFYLREVRYDPYQMQAVA